MKKLIMLLGVVASVAVAQADCTWDWWFGRGKEDIKGCALGIGCSNGTVKGAQIGLAATKSDKVDGGVQGAIGYSETGTLRNGAQVGFVTRAKSAALQFGLICFNETGFLPVFVFFNFDKAMFGGAR